MGMTDTTMSRGSNKEVMIRWCCIAKDGGISLRQLISGLSYSPWLLKFPCRCKGYATGW